MDDDLLIRRLKWLADSTNAPSRDSKQALRLHDVLSQPKRVTIMGPPKTGKLNLLSLLAGNRVVGSDLALGTIRLVFGAKAQSKILLADGESMTVEGLPNNFTIPKGRLAVETTIEAPLPALRKISLMRLAEANDIDSQIKAMRWASAHSDIVIWCTSRFSGIEAKMWAHMPDQTRDHAFALLTNLAGHDGDVSRATSDISKRVGDDFAFALAMDLTAALAAQVSTPVDKKSMTKSGASKLISTLLREIEQGRENAAAQAEILLARHEDVPEDFPDAKVAPEEVVEEFVPPSEPETKPEPEAEPELAPKEEAPSAAPKVQAAIDDLAASIGGKADKASRQAKGGSKRKAMDPNIFPMFELAPDEASPSETETKQDAAPESPPEEKSDAAPLSDATVTVCQDIISRLATVGATDDNASRDLRDMYDAGLETLSWIDVTLADVANDDVPRLARLQHMTEEATDLIQLLRLEDNETSAVDAVSVLLQMKRTVHAVLAA